MKDRHENSKWEFRKERIDESGNKVRLYRSRQRPELFKRVIKCTSTTGNSQWETSQYTLKGAQLDGEQVWVVGLDKVDGIMEGIAETKKNRKRAYSS